MTEEPKETVDSSTISSDVIDVAEEEKTNRYVIVIDDPAEGIVFQVNGLDMNEALILMLKGKLKFQKLYDKWLEDQI